MIFTLDHLSLDVERVSTPAAMSQGLSGRKSLADNQGMLFVFPQEGYHSFWMKGMLFPIDIIWLDKDYKVVYVKENAQPCTFLYCPLYTPNKPAQYVLEAVPGTFKRL